jgi:hypothetical protein
VPSWPATLPQEQFIGLTDQRQVAVVRTQMDEGPAKVRRKFSAAVRDVMVPIVLNGTQRGAFDPFFISDLEEGALAFDWDDPVTDSTLSFRFIEPPQWTLEVGGAPAARIWKATMKLEILP